MVVGLFTRTFERGEGVWSGSRKEGVLGRRSVVWSITEETGRSRKGSRTTPLGESGRLVRDTLTPLP